MASKDLRTIMTRACPGIWACGGTVIEGMVSRGIPNTRILDSLTKHRFDWTYVVFVFVMQEGKPNRLEMKGKALNCTLSEVAGLTNDEFKAVFQMVEDEDLGRLELISVGYVISPNRNGIPSNGYHATLNHLKAEGCYDRDIAKMSVEVLEASAVTNMTKALTEYTMKEIE